MSHSFLDPVIFHNASWHKQYLPLLQTALNQVIIRNLHLTIVQWKINMLLNLGLAILVVWGYGGWARYFGRTCYFWGSLLLGFNRGHNFLILFSGVFSFASLQPVFSSSCFSCQLLLIFQLWFVSYISLAFPLLFIPSFICKPQQWKLLLRVIAAFQHKISIIQNDGRLSCILILSTCDHTR